MDAGVTLSPADWRRFAALLAALRAGRGVCPSYQDLAALWGLRSKSSVSRYLDRLEAAGLIFRLAGTCPNLSSPRIRALPRGIGVTRHLVPVATRAGDVLMPMREVRT